MGRDKARMLFCGEPLIERVLCRLAQVAGELVVTTSRPGELTYLEELMFDGLRPRVVMDVDGPAGAMRGIASSLAAVRLPLAADRRLRYAVCLAGTHRRACRSC